MQLHNSILVWMVFRFEDLRFKSRWEPTACELLTVFKQQDSLHFQWMVISDGQNWQNTKSSQARSHKPESSQDEPRSEKTGVIYM